MPKAPAGCPDGTVDCDGSGECAPASWIGDGSCDGVDQAYGYDLSCYDNDGGDGGTVGGGCHDGQWECDNGECINALYYCEVQLKMETLYGDVTVQMDLMKS